MTKAGSLLANSPEDEDANVLVEHRKHRYDPPYYLPSLAASDGVVKAPRLLEKPESANDSDVRALASCLPCIDPHPRKLSRLCYFRYNRPRIWHATLLCHVFIELYVDRFYHQELQCSSQLCRRLEVL